MPKHYTISDKYAVDTHTIKDGILVKKTDEIHPDANKRKLIIANKSNFTGAFIDNGKIGLTGNHKYYILGENLEVIQKMLCFKIFKNIVCNYTKYRQQFLDTEALSFIPDIRKLEIKDITEESFYKLIKLTQDEINMVNNSK